MNFICFDVTIEADARTVTRLPAPSMSEAVTAPSNVVEAQA
jgi:hypothetical protein